MQLIKSDLVFLHLRISFPSLAAGLSFKCFSWLPQFFILDGVTFSTFNFEDFIHALLRMKKLTTNINFSEDGNTSVEACSFTVKDFEVQWRFDSSEDTIVFEIDQKIAKGKQYTAIGISDSSQSVRNLCVHQKSTPRVKSGHRWEEHRCKR